MKVEDNGRLKVEDNGVGLGLDFLGWVWFGLNVENDDVADDDFQEAMLKTMIFWVWFGLVWFVDFLGLVWFGLIFWVWFSGFGLILAMFEIDEDCLVWFECWRQWCCRRPDDDGLNVEDNGLVWWRLLARLMMIVFYDSVLFNFLIFYLMVLFLNM